MKWIPKKSVNIPIWVIRLLILMIVCVILIYLLYNVISDPKTSGIIGGIVAGIIGYIISFIIGTHEYAQIEKFRKQGIIEVLPDRRKKDYYREIVKVATRKVEVIGTSCTRFINDFADCEADDHVLVDALERNIHLKVNLLIPVEEKMDEQSKDKFKVQEPKIIELQKKYGERFQLKRYDFEAGHSFVRIDNDIIVGPVFQGTESQNSPAIHFNIESPYAKKYHNYFLEIWGKSSPL